MRKYCPDPDHCNYSDCPTAFCDAKEPLVPAPGSACNLDPATVTALQPIHEAGTQAMRERDAWNRWACKLAMDLKVSLVGFKSKVIAEQYEELRERISKKLNDMSSATESSGDESAGCKPDVRCNDLLGHGLSFTADKQAPEGQNQARGEILQRGIKYRIAWLFQFLTGRDLVSDIILGHHGAWSEASQSATKETPQQCRK